MSGMRLVGLLMLGLGLLIVWEVLQGRSPLDHLQQLIDLFGHQHNASSPPPGPGKGPEPAPQPVPQSGGAFPGGPLVTP